MPDGPSIARSCPWCSAPASDAAGTCAACGAALAQRESIGDVQIAGLTAIDPGLLAADARPIHLGGPSPSHGVADAAVAAAAIGGPAGLMIIGGIAAVAAAEYAGARRPGAVAPEDLAKVGQPSELALRALERITAAGEAPVGTPADSVAEARAPEAAAPDPWRDLPPAAPADA